MQVKSEYLYELEDVVKEKIEEKKKEISIIEEANNIIRENRNIKSQNVLPKLIIFFTILLIVTIAFLILHIVIGLETLPSSTLISCLAFCVLLLTGMIVLLYKN